MDLHEECLVRQKIYFFITKKPVKNVMYFIQNYGLDLRWEQSTKRLKIIISV